MTNKPNPPSPEERAKLDLVLVHPFTPIGVLWSQLGVAGFTPDERRKLTIMFTKQLEPGMLSLFSSEEVGETIAEDAMEFLSGQIDEQQ